MPTSDGVNSVSDIASLAINLKAELLVCDARRKALADIIKENQ